MRDADCIAFLQHALPRLHLRWPGFRRVRRQVCRRLDRRLRALGLDSLDAYREYLERNPEEWKVLDRMCVVTISRFWRDRSVFDALRGRLLPELATLADERGERELRVWSAGCGSGEEPWSLAVVWHLELAQRHPDLVLSLTATDVDERLIRRASDGVYRDSSLRELPLELRARAFEPLDGGHRLRPGLRAGVAFRCEDLRAGAPLDRGPFHLVLCRNLAFTYFDEELQREVLLRIAESLAPGGALVTGSHEQLPRDSIRFARDPALACIHRLRDPT